MTQCENDLPAGLFEHLSTQDIPKLYYWFWSFGAFCCIIISIVMLPTIYEISKQASNIRNKSYDMILYPLSHVILTINTACPIIVSILEYFVFLSPLNVYTNDFILTMFEGLVLYLFTRLLIMYLGTLQNAMDAFKNSPATKFYAVPPFGCCFRSCMRPKFMTTNDFRNLYYLIIQYAFISPIIAYSGLLRSMNGDSQWVIRLLLAAKAISSMFCIYGLLALLKASRVVLAQFNIRGKFICIKGLIGALLLPSMIMQITGGFDGYNEQYTSEVINDAVSAFITLICFIPLSFGFRRFFNVDDAKKAMKNASQMSYVAARYETLDVGQQREDYALMTET